MEQHRQSSADPVATGYCLLPHRGVFRISGAEAKTWLQGLVSGNVARVSPETAIHTALLTPQGKFLHDLFMVETPDGLVVETELARRADLMRRLTLYRLRTKVEITALDDWAVFALNRPLGELQQKAGTARGFAGGIAFIDPRLAELGTRILAPKSAALARLAELGFSEISVESIDRHRIGLGVPDGSRDIEVEKGLLLEHGFDALNGVDFAKGCYVGQELTARTKYRGLLKKRLMIVEGSAPLPPTGTIISLNGDEAGEMRSSTGNIGLALMRLEKVALALENKARFQAGNTDISVTTPPYIEATAEQDQG